MENCLLFSSLSRILWYCAFSLSLSLKPGAPRTVPLLLPPPPRDPPPNCNDGTDGDAGFDGTVGCGQGRSKGDDETDGGRAGSPGLRRFSRPRSSRTASTAGCRRRRPGCCAPRFKNHNKVFCLEKNAQKIKTYLVLHDLLVDQLLPLLDGVLPLIDAVVVRAGGGLWKGEGKC